MSVSKAEARRMKGKDLCAKLCHDQMQPMQPCNHDAFDENRISATQHDSRCPDASQASNASSSSTLVKDSKPIRNKKIIFCKANSASKLPTLCCSVVSIQSLTNNQGLIMGCKVRSLVLTSECTA